MSILPSIPIAGSLGFLCLFAAGYLLYRAGLPRPIEGIPYNKHAAHRILGDVPAALQHHGRTQEMFSFLTSQLVKHNSPIIQLFLRPLGRPWVVISDFREMQDILTRRTHEFDRSEFFGDLFINLIPGNQVHLPTGDEWKSHRRLMADTMSNSFLFGVVGPRIYESTTVLIEFWREKVRLADGHPSEMHQDVYKAAFDAIWAASFGEEIGTTRSQLKHLRGIERLADSKDKDAPITFPTARDPEDYTAIMTLGASTEIAMNSPVPRLHHGLAMRFYPSLVSAGKRKNNLIKGRLDAAWRNFSAEGTSEDDVRCALDLIVQREATMAKRDGRPPAHDTQVIRDELFGFLLAGHETTSTTICWGLKMLTAYPVVQHKLRSTLHAAFKEAYDAGETPSIQEIVGSSIPYLEATIEEIHRCGGTSPAHIRRAMQDTEIFGYQIPKGTDVFMMTNGPGFKSEPLPLDEKKRSRSSQESENRPGMWDVSDIGVFMPERWLAKDEKGDMVFDARAGPAQPFGGGPRACFGESWLPIVKEASLTMPGRKLASLELKIMFIMAMWNFELLPTPPGLSTFAGRDIMTHTPQDVYLRLAIAK